MDKHLAIYLRDQLAMGVLWRQLARRACRNNRGTALGAALGRVQRGIAEDVGAFRMIMQRVGVRPNPVKTGLAALAEVLGRVKFNGRLRGYSPLSRFEELEILTMGIDRKQQLWTTLRDQAGLGARLSDVDFDGLITRARRQREELEPFRSRAGAEAFSG